MKVRCKKILDDEPPRRNRGNEFGGLTVGKNYIVISMYFNNRGLYYQLEDNGGNLVIFKADQFEVISGNIPSNWEIVIKSYTDGSYYLDLSPRAWNQAVCDFYEEITEVSWPLYEWRKCEKIPEVVSLYFQERDLIYQEELEHEGAFACQFKQK